MKVIIAGVVGMALTVVGSTEISRLLFHGSGTAELPVGIGIILLYGLVLKAGSSVLGKKAPRPGLASS